MQISPRARIGAWLESEAKQNRGWRLQLSCDLFLNKILQYAAYFQPLQLMRENAIRLNYRRGVSSRIFPKGVKALFLSLFFFNCHIISCPRAFSHGRIANINQGWQISKAMATNEAVHAANNFDGL